MKLWTANQELLNHYPTNLDRGGGGAGDTGLAAYLSGKCRLLGKGCGLFVQ